MAATMGDAGYEGYPQKHVYRDHTQWRVRCTVSAGPVLTCDHGAWTVVDETGTGKYSLNGPASAGKCGIYAQVVKTGGSTTLTTLIRGNTLHVPATGVWLFDVLGLLVSAGTLALADLVDGDVIEFLIDAETRV